MMERNRFTLLFSFILLVAVSTSYAEGLSPLTCEGDETPAFVISYDHYVTRLIDEQADKRGRQIITVTADTRYYFEAGETLGVAARQRGETTYTSYQKERWETMDAVYTYLSDSDIARVRRHPLIEKSQIPYDVPAQHESLRTIAGYQCSWCEEDYMGVQKTQRCEAVFYGWVTPLYTRKIAEGRDVLLSEATDISQHCVKKESLYAPQNKPWKFSE